VQFIWHNDTYTFGHNTDTLQHKIQITPITDLNTFQAMNTNSSQIGILKILVFSGGAGPPGVRWRIMCPACHTVRLPQVFSAAASFKCPTCETAGTK